MGRSAVSTNNGTWAIEASTMAGKKLAPAVPDVQSRATGWPDSFASPRAKKAALRSSIAGQVLSPICSAQAKTIGPEREPGQTTTEPTPPKVSCSTKARAQSWLRLADSIATSDCLQQRQALGFRFVPLCLGSG